MGNAPQVRQNHCYRGYIVTSYLYPLNHFCNRLVFITFHCIYKIGVVTGPSFYVNHNVSVIVLDGIGFTHVIITQRTELTSLMAAFSGAACRSSNGGLIRCIG